MNFNLKLENINKKSEYRTTKSILDFESDCIPTIIIVVRFVFDVPIRFVSPNRLSLV